jgi:tetratricopeptide (TPR) repeat protein
MNLNTKDRLTTVDQDQKRFFIDYLNQVGFFSLEELHPLYKQSNPEQIDDIRLKVIMMAGIGKNLSLEGDFIEAKRSLEAAQDIAEKNLDTVKDDYLAFLYYEQGLFYSKVGDYLNAKRYVILAKIHAISKNLELLINFQIEYFNVYKTGPTDVNGILPYLNEFHNRKMYFMEVMTMVRLGIIYEGNKDWKNADSYFRKGLKIAKEKQIYYLEDMINNSIGYTYANKGEYDQALNVLNTALEDVKSYYYRALMMENIGYVYYLKLDYKSASEKYLEVYNFAKAHNVISQLPEECLFLGDCYEQMGNVQQALMYYKLGYDHAFYQVAEGFGLNGFRKKAMTTYLTYLERMNYRKFDGKSMENPFEFSLGKEWREIRDIFQYHLIMHHKNKAYSRETFLSGLKMKSSTYYTLQNKLKKQGYKIPGIKEPNKPIPEDVAIETLNLYIRNTLEHLSWEDANKRFEKDIFLYLYRQYGFQKNRLGSALNLSQPIIRAKTGAIVYAYDQGLNR